MKRVASWLLLLAGFALLAGCSNPGSLIEEQATDMNKLADAIEAGQTPQQYQDLVDRIRERGAKLDELTDEQISELEEEYGKAYVQANRRVIQASESRESSAAEKKQE